MFLLRFGAGQVPDFYPADLGVEAEMTLVQQVWRSKAPTLRGSLLGHPAFAFSSLFTSGRVGFILNNGSSVGATLLARRATRGDTTSEFRELLPPFG